MYIINYVHNFVTTYVCMYVQLPYSLRPCLHKLIFDLKRSCLDTFLPFVYTETPKNEYVPKNAF